MPGLHLLPSADPNQSTHWSWRALEESISRRGGLSTDRSTADPSCGEATFFSTLRRSRYLLSACCRIKEIMCKLDYEKTHFSLRIRNTQGVLFILSYQHTSPLPLSGNGQVGLLRTSRPSRYTNSLSAHH